MTTAQLHFILGLMLIISGCRYIDPATAGNVIRGNPDTYFGKGQGAEDDDDTVIVSDQVIVVRSVNDLPICAEATQNQVYYVKNSKEFFVCTFNGTDYGYQNVEIENNEVILQNCPAERLLQTTEEVPMGDSRCSEGLGGLTIQLGCDLNANDTLDLPTEASGNPRVICNQSAPAQTSADLAFALSATGADSANCSVESPCLTFAHVVSKIPKTINHQVSVTIEAGMTLRETGLLQGFTIGSQGSLTFLSSDPLVDWTLYGENDREYSLKIEGVSGSGRLIIRDLHVSGATQVGVYMESANVVLGRITVDTNGSDNDSAGMVIENGSRVTVLGAGDGGPYPIVISNNTGDGLRLDAGGEADLEVLTVTNNTRDGIRVLGDSELRALAISSITGSGAHGVNIADSVVVLGGATNVNVPNDTGGALITTTAAAAINAVSNSRLTLTNLRLNSTTSFGLQANDSRVNIERCTFNNNGTNGVRATDGSVLLITNAAFENNTNSGLRLFNSTARMNEGNPAGSIIRVRGNGKVSDLGGISLGGNSLAVLEWPYDIQDNGTNGNLAIVFNDAASTFTRSLPAIAGVTTVCDDGGMPVAGPANGCDINYCTDSGDPLAPACSNPQAP